MMACVWAILGMAQLKQAFVPNVKLWAGHPTAKEVYVTLGWRMDIAHW